MHGKKIVSNSIISVVYRLVLLLIGFISRKIFIVYLGEEILGLNSLYGNLLDLLNLADLGIGVAVQYQLYEPLVKKDNTKLSKIMSSAKKIYNCIGVFVLVMGIVSSFFIQYLIKETIYPLSFIRCSYLISVVGVSLGYFFVHMRLFLLADEEMGVVNILDIAAKILTTVISLITTVVFCNYYVYLIINSLYGVLSNIFVYFIFRKKYPDICSSEKNIKKEMRTLTSDLKNVIPMKLSNYIYNSTDNIIVSKVLGLTTVALYSNYMTIINGIMGVEYLLGNVLLSPLGKIIKEIGNKDSTVYNYYLLFQYVQFVFTNFCTVSLLVLCTPFIEMFFGKRFLVSNFVLVLLIVDFFIHSMYQPAYVMYGAAGKFKDDKVITMMSAIMNIVISIVMVNIIGLSGVIVGTLVTDLYIWGVRTYQVVKQYFRQNIGLYIIKMLKYIFITGAGIVTTLMVIKSFCVDSKMLDFLLRILICLIIPNLICIVLSVHSSEMNNLRKFCLNIIQGKRN